MRIGKSLSLTYNRIGQNGITLFETMDFPADLKVWWIVPDSYYQPLV